MHRTIYNLPL